MPVEERLEIDLDLDESSMRYCTLDDHSLSSRLLHKESSSWPCRSPGCTTKRLLIQNLLKGNRLDKHYSMDPNCQNSSRISMNWWLCEKHLPQKISPFFPLPLPSTSVRSSKLFGSRCGCPSWAALGGGFVLILCVSQKPRMFFVLKATSKTLKGADLGKPEQSLSSSINICDIAKTILDLWVHIFIQVSPLHSTTCSRSPPKKIGSTRPGCWRRSEQIFSRLAMGSSMRSVSATERLKMTM